MPDITVADQRTALRAWLARHRPEEEVGWAETHVSILAFTRDRAWKLKKAVAYPFVDLSSRELRSRQCEREVKLNRRLAPDVYLGVVPLDDDSGAVVDHLVEMRRMPDDRRLAALVTQATESTSCLDRVADVIARFHSEAPSGGAIDAAASRDAVGDLWAENLAELTVHSGSTLDRSALEQVASLARGYLAGRAALFAERIAAGRARDGHGDLLADDIFCLPDGPRVLDCLEFDDHLRYGDGLADVAFLAMDLERLGRADLARRFLDRYAAAATDEWPASLEHLYVAYRAVVRAKVACLRADDGVAEAAELARRLLTIARDHLESGRVRLVLIGGPPATGKTTLANAVARRLHWPVLHSDEVRKELAGIAATTHERTALDTGIYTPAWDARTYAALAERAREHLERGRGVVLDASWNDQEQRGRASRLAGATSSELIAFRCAAPHDVSATRAAARASVGTDASDAIGEIAENLTERFAAWPEATVLDTTSSAEVVASAVVAALAARPADAP
jgi:Uncharacterized protein conserved in bacteria